MKLNNIDITFNYTDKEGKEIKINGSLGFDGWQQWGQTKDILVKNVNLIEALQNAVIEETVFEDWF